MSSAPLRTGGRRRLAVEPRDTQGCGRAAQKGSGCGRPAQKGSGCGRPAGDAGWRWTRESRRVSAESSLVRPSVKPSPVRLSVKPSPVRPEVLEGPSRGGSRYRGQQGVDELPGIERRQVPQALARADEEYWYLEFPFDCKGYSPAGRTVQLREENAGAAHRFLE